MRIRATARTGARLEDVRAVLMQVTVRAGVPAAYHSEAIRAKIATARVK